MSAFAEFLLWLAMAVGIVGAIVPVLPGIWLTWLAGFAWASFDGGGHTRWTLFAVMTAFFAIAVYASFALPASQVTGRQTKRTLSVAAVLGVIGFFVIPIIGLPLGFGAGVFGMSVAGGASVSEAAAATIATLRAFGASVVVQVGCGMGIAAMFLVGLILT